MAGYRSDAERRRSTGLLGAMSTDPEAPGLTPLEAALMAAGGPIGRAVTAAPRAAGLGLGMLAGTGGLNEAEAQQQKAKANPNVPDDIRAMASRLPAELQGRYIDLAMRSRARSASATERQELNRLSEIITSSAKGANDAEQAGLMDAGLRANQARERVMRDAPKSFQERFGDAASWTPIAPLAAAFGTMLPVAGRNAMGASKAASQWRGAVDRGLGATDAPTLANSAALAKSYADKFPEQGVKSALAPYAIPAAIGGIEGAAIANIPDEWNASLPPENPERKAYEAYLKELPETHPDYARAKRIYDSLPLTNPARDAALSYFQNPGQVIAKTGIGALQGAGGGALATSIGKWFAPSEKSLPRAGTAALQARLAGTGMDDATRAIQSESAAMGSVLPLPPPRAQLPPATYANPPPSPVPGPPPRPQLAPAQPPPSGGYDPLAIQAQRIGKVAAPGVAVTGGILGAMSGSDPAGASEMPDLATIIKMVEAGQLPVEVLRDLLPAAAGR